MADLKPFLEDMISMSTGTDGHTLEIHFSRPVTKEDRQAFAAAHNAIVRGDLSASPKNKVNVNAKGTDSETPATCCPDDPNSDPDNQNIQSPKDTIAAEVCRGPLADLAFTALGPEVCDNRAPHPQDNMPCPCTTFEQDEVCPVGFPSLLCSACKGTGSAPAETVVALAAEMMKVAEQVDELEDPFAAWETIDLIKSQNEKRGEALEPFARFFKSELHDLSVASDATIFAAFQDQATGAPLADLSIADVRRAYAALATTEGSDA